MVQVRDNEGGITNISRLVEVFPSDEDPPQQELEQILDDNQNNDKKLFTTLQLFSEFSANKKGYLELKRKMLEITDTLIE